MVDVTVRDGGDVDRIVRNIRAHADRKALEKDLRGGLNRATKGIRTEMVDAIPAALPRRGGLAAQFQAKTSSSISAKSGRYAGVSLRFRNREYDIRTLTGQRLRHPVFGNRLVWVTQTAGVDPSRFNNEFDRQKPAIQREVVRVMDDVARKVTS